MPFDIAALKDVFHKHPVAVIAGGGGVVLVGVLAMGGKKKTATDTSSAGSQLAPPSWWLGQSSGGYSSYIPPPTPVIGQDPKPMPAPGGIPFCPPGYSYNPVTQSCEHLSYGDPFPHPDPDPGPTPDPTPFDCNLSECPPGYYCYQGRCIVEHPIGGPPGGDKGGGGGVLTAPSTVDGQVGSDSTMRGLLASQMRVLA